MQNLERLIRLAQENDENAMLEIIGKFQPLINKYFKKSYYNEDMKNELILKLIEVVKIELKQNNLLNRNEGSLVNYIVASLYHQYLAISDKTDKKSKFEFSREDDIIIKLIDFHKSYSDKNIEKFILYDSFREILTEREFYCLYFIEYMGYTAEDLAVIWGVTRQACNQCKKRAHDKIKKHFSFSELMDLFQL